MLNLLKRIVYLYLFNFTQEVKQRWGDVRYKRLTRLAKK